MFGRVGVVLVPFLLLAVWLVQRSRRPLELDPSRQGEVLAGHRTAVGWRLAGLGLGVVAAAFTASVGSLGLGVMLAPTVFGICVIAGVVVGELATIPRRGVVRTAALETRTVGDYLPRRLGAMVAASTLGLGTLLVTTTLMGSADDMGRAGRSLFRLCGPERSAGAGPWPGLFYSLPLGVVVAIGLFGAAVALRAVVVAATGVMVAASLFGVALAAGGALLGFACPPRSWTVLGGALLAVGALMLLLAVWCLALLLGVPRIRPMVSPDTAAAGPAVRR